MSPQPTAQNGGSDRVAEKPLTLGMKATCRHCWEPIHTTNFATGVGWDHTNRSQLSDTRCRIFASPRPETIEEAGR